MLQAHRNSHRKLTGAAYVWILPLFYDTHWWRLSQHQINNLRPTQRCSNYEMREILNTTHVLSVGLHHHLVPSLDTGWNQTVAIVRELLVGIANGHLLSICIILTFTSTHVTISKSGVKK